MGLWISPIQEGRIGFYAGRCHMTPSHPVGNEAWRHRCDGSTTRHGSTAGHPVARCDPRVVPPAYYVELRALEIRKEETEAPDPGYPPSESPSHVLRPWPFRWPVPDVEADADAIEPSPMPEQIKGQFLDIWA